MANAGMHFIDIEADFTEDETGLFIKVFKLIIKCNFDQYFKSLQQNLKIELISFTNNMY